MLEERGFLCTNPLSHLQAHTYVHEVVELERAGTVEGTISRHGDNDVFQSCTVQIH